MKNLVLVSATLALVGALGACSERSAPGDGGSGGATGGGGAGSGGAGSGGLSCGSGGAVHLPACEDWLGEPGSSFAGAPSFGALAVTCGGEGGGGGDGGATAGTKPALRRLCEGPSRPDLQVDHPFYWCLEPLLDDPCAESHEAAVRACLELDGRCHADVLDSECGAMREDCPGLSLGSCALALSVATNRSVVGDCFAEPREGESCEARFVRCAWDL